MSTSISIPEITIAPSDVPTGDPGKQLYAWKMKIFEESTMDSEDHGDDFDSVAEALAHAYGVFADLVNRRHLYPAMESQQFKLTVIQA